MKKKRKEKKPPASTVYYLQISTCARVPLQTPPSLLPCKTPPEDCVPMRGRTKDSLPVTFVCTVFTGMVLLPLESTVTDITVKNHKAKTNKRSWICLSEIGAYCAFTYRILTYVFERISHPPTYMDGEANITLHNKHALYEQRCTCTKIAILFISLCSVAVQNAKSKAKRMKTLL